MPHPASRTRLSLTSILAVASTLLRKTNLGRIHSAMWASFSESPAPEANQSGLALEDRLPDVDELTRGMVVCSLVCTSPCDMCPEPPQHDPIELGNALWCLPGTLWQT